MLCHRHQALLILGGNGGHITQLHFINAVGGNAVQMRGVATQRADVEQIHHQSDIGLVEPLQSLPRQRQRVVHAAPGHRLIHDAHVVARGFRGHPAQVIINLISTAILAGAGRCLNGVAAQRLSDPDKLAQLLTLLSAQRTRCAGKIAQHLQIDKAGSL